MHVCVVQTCCSDRYISSSRLSLAFSLRSIAVTPVVSSFTTACSRDTAFIIVVGNQGNLVKLYVHASHTTNIQCDGSTTAEPDKLLVCNMVTIHMHADCNSLQGVSCVSGVAYVSYLCKSCVQGASDFFDSSTCVKHRALTQQGIVVIKASTTLVRYLVGNHLSTLCKPECATCFSET